MMNIEEITDRFDIPHHVTSIEPYGNGHINDTYLVRCQNALEFNYLLQKVNHNVFKNIEGLMNNIAVVTSHIRAKLLESKIQDVERRSLELIKAKNGHLYIEEDGQFWRVFNFIEDHKVYDGAPNNEIAYEGARMFGQFLHQLSDLDPLGIVDTIPNFHNIKYRLSNLEEAIKADPLRRVCCLDKEIEYVRSRHEIMSVIQNLGEKKLLTPRIVHNDTKINNVLFDHDNKGLCVVDLDTIMPGFVHYDFGDGIRTCANTGAEDDEDLKNIEYDLDIIKAYSTGFIDSVHSILNRDERSTLAHAALLFPFIMGVRFLTDYISGDVYYKVEHTHHNYFRARAQLKLTQDGETKLEEIQQIVDGCFI